MNTVNTEIIVITNNFAELNTVDLQRATLIIEITESENKISYNIVKHRYGKQSVLTERMIMHALIDEYIQSVPAREAYS